jgi:serine/threonine-protein kinase
MDLFGTAMLQQVLQRFEREAKSLAKLSHPNIVKILDSGEFEDCYYYAMEFIDGGASRSSKRP